MAGEIQEFEASVNNLMPKFKLSLTWASEFAKGNIAKAYQEMSVAAGRLAFQEARWHSMMKYKERIMTSLDEQQSESHEKRPLLDSIFLEHFNERRKYHMAEMYKMLELFAQNRFLAPPSSR